MASRSKSAGTRLNIFTPTGNAFVVANFLVSLEVYGRCVRGCSAASGDEGTISRKEHVIGIETGDKLAIG